MGRGRLERGSQTELLHLPNGVGQEVDSDAEHSQLGDRFEDANPEAHFVKTERCGEAADAGADDQDLVLHSSDVMVRGALGPGKTN